MRRVRLTSVAIGPTVPTHVDVPIYLSLPGAIALLTKAEVIERAVKLITENGARVVPSFDGVTYDENQLIATFWQVNLVDDQWAVLFGHLDRPGEASSPGSSIVMVHPVTGEAEFFDVL